MDALVGGLARECLCPFVRARVVSLLQTMAAAIFYCGTWGGLRRMWLCVEEGACRLGGKGIREVACELPHFSFPPVEGVAVGGCAAACMGCVCMCVHAP